MLCTVPLSICLVLVFFYQCDEISTVEPYLLLLHFLFAGKLHNGVAFITYSANDDYRCKRFDFDPSSKATDNVHVQLRLRLLAYNVAVSWIESVTKVG